MGKDGKKRDAEKEKKKATTLAVRGDVTLPPSRIQAALKSSGRAKRVAGVSTIFATAAIEAVVDKLLDEVYVKAKTKKVEEEDGRLKKRITPADVGAAIRSNLELSKTLGGHTFGTVELLGKATEVVLTKEARDERKRVREEKKQSKNTEGIEP